MEQRIVLQEKTKFIYFIKENDISFYLMIPNNQKLSIVLNIIDNINDEQVKTLESIPNHAMIIPVLSYELLESVLKNQAEDFNRLDSICSKMINFSHKTLTYNHLQVDSSVFLVENQKYTMFNTWFIRKYGGRVSLIKQNNTTSSEINRENASPVIKGNPQTNEQEKKINEPNLSEITQDSSQKDLGFVSYVLLGVVAAVASLIFLYFII